MMNLLVIQNQIVYGLLKLKQTKKIVKTVSFKGCHSLKHRTRHRKGSYGGIATCMYAKINILKGVTLLKIHSTDYLW